MATRNTRKRRPTQRRQLPRAYILGVILIVALGLALWNAAVRLKSLRFENEVLRKMEMDARMQSALALAQLNCAAPCVVATENDCSEETLADYCLATVSGGLDLNGDGDRADFVAPLRARGLRLEHGLCEDTVYCREIRLCGCRATLDRCVDVLCRRYTTRGPAEATARVRGALPFGGCLSGEEHLAQQARNLTWDAGLDGLLAQYCR